MNTWHIVTSEGHCILGVFGSALLADAQKCAAKVERQTGLQAYVFQVTRENCPAVGEYYRPGF